MNENFSLTLKEWADEDKPREKMLAKGKKELTNAELIAILLRSGLRGKSVVEVAKEVLTRSGNSLTTLSQMEFKQLSAVKGLGRPKPPPSWQPSNLDGACTAKSETGKN